MRIAPMLLRGFNERLRHIPNASDRTNMENRLRLIAYVHHTMEFGPPGFAADADPEEEDTPKLPRKGYWTASWAGDWPPDIANPVDTSYQRHGKKALKSALERKLEIDERRKDAQPAIGPDGGVGPVTGKHYSLRELVELSTETRWHDHPPSPRRPTRILESCKDHHLVTVANLRVEPVTLFSTVELGISTTRTIPGGGMETFRMSPGDELLACSSKTPLYLCITRSLNHAYYIVDRWAEHNQFLLNTEVNSK